ncbi:cation-translocating P-type ATPase [Caproiciproducens faecalis]|uniref:Cation-translocating P-type ATPase n=1 Tax=Caproiciproducens faecalis TaxID=2820301 RepID=A0ABS7DQZ7_9FIRM|nr:cation-translocating P-type ATPase [Caproiciproducens faecalis]MBW7573516.1 cation-translocating P-type ATPase [Caproiciproducens faecalis]
MMDENGISGLSAEQVAARQKQGLVNGTEEIKTKTVGQIIHTNLITPFNILNAILAGLILMVGSYKNLLFMGVIISNTLIGIVQEIKAKKTIDRLKLIAAPKAHVLRDGAKQDIPVSDLVLDDIMVLASGNQICADCIVVQGECEVNEALITGEADLVAKKAGDRLLSGSFIGSGSCLAKVEHIGAENYASKITQSAKYLKKPNSEIMTWINKIIKYIGFSIIPIGLLLFYKQLYLSGQPFNRAVVSTVAALIGMIPEGLVLLTSVVLAVSVLRLAHHKALVQDLYSIETLARVDTLCLDKTGTITEGTMQMDAIVPLCDISRQETEDAVAALVNAVNDDNPTANALKALDRNPPPWKCAATVAFSSARKWSGASFHETGSFVLGAGEFILKEGFEKIRQVVEKYSSQGQRVLLLAHSESPLGKGDLPADISPLALILLSDKIRKNAKKTLEYFSAQGVDIKVISGDNPVTVANIAKKAGLRDAGNYVDATTLKSYEEIKTAAVSFSVFGRVTPQQKLDLVKALKEQNRTVAMTGDGVNDVLALKESDCSIAMASGSDASKTVSQVVLLDSDFASMPRIVNEGRRSINNLQRSASLFLVKAMFSAIIAVLFIFFTCDYPFQPIQFTLINAVTIGYPSFILALEPNRERIHGKFIVNVIKKALPGALTMVLNIVLLVFISGYLNFTPEQISTMAVIITGYTGLMTLFKVCMPFNLKHAALFSSMSAAFILALIFFKPLFAVVGLTLPMVLVLVPMLIVATSLMTAILHMVEKVIMKKIGS